MSLNFNPHGPLSLFCPVSLRSLCKSQTHSAVYLLKLSGREENKTESKLSPRPRADSFQIFSIQFKLSVLSDHSENTKRFKFSTWKITFHHIFRKYEIFFNRDNSFFHCTEVCQLSLIN